MFQWHKQLTCDILQLERVSALFSIVCNSWRNWCTSVWLPSCFCSPTASQCSLCSIQTPRRLCGAFCSASSTDRISAFLNSSISVNSKVCTVFHVSIHIISLFSEALIHSRTGLYRFFLETTIVHCSSCRPPTVIFYTQDECRPMLFYGTWNVR